MIPVALLIGGGVAVGALIGRRSARFTARAEARHELAQARAHMNREVTHWQDAAARASAEATRIAREAQAFKDGCKHGREDVISIMPLLVAAQQHSADEARASGNES